MVGFGEWVWLSDIEGSSPRCSVCTAKLSPEEISPMTLPQSAVSDLLDALRAGDGVDLVRESVRIVLQS